MNAIRKQLLEADDKSIAAVSIVHHVVKAPSPVPADTGAVDMTLLDTCESCTIHADCWDDIRTSCGVLTPNNDPMLFRAVLESDDHMQPMVLIARQDGDVTGMVIGRTSNRRLTSRLGYATIPTSRLQMMDVVHGGVLFRSETAARALSSHLSRLLMNRDVDGIMFNHLPTDTPHCEVLHEHLQEHLHMQRGPDALHWRFSLAAGGFDETLQRFSRKHRYNIRRADRLLNDAFDGQVILDCCRGVSEFDRFIDRVNSITQSSYQGALSRPMVPGTAEYSVLKRAAERGLLRGYVLSCAGQPVAHQVGVVCGSTYHLRSTAFDPAYAEHSPGQVLLLRVMEDLTSATIRHIDYGFGDGAYKRMYGSDCGIDRTHVYFRRTAYPRMCYYQLRSLQRFDQLIREACDRGRSLKWIKNAWRSRLIRTPHKGHPGH